MTTTDLIGVVVVNYGSSHLLAHHLLPLAGADSRFHPVVVDNFCSEQERSCVAELCHRQDWTLIEQPNVGFGAGANAGMAAAFAAGCRSALLINPDASISAVAVHELARHLESSPTTLVAPVIRRPDGQIWSEGSWLELDRGRTRGRPPEPARGPATFWISAACLMTTPSAWTRTGGFDEEYFLYWEDVDLSERARRARVELVVRDDIEATHDEGGTQRGTDASGLSWQYYFYNVRNRLLFGATHLDDRRWRRWLWHTLTESYVIMMRGDGRGVLLRSPLRATWTVARGIRSGLRAARPRRAARSRNAERPSLRRRGPAQQPGRRT